MQMNANIKQTEKCVILWGQLAIGQCFENMN